MPASKETGSIRAMNLPVMQPIGRVIPPPMPRAIHLELDAGTLKIVIGAIERFRRVPRQHDKKKPLPEHSLQKDS